MGALAERTRLEESDLLRSYNTSVNAIPPQHDASGKRHRHAVYATETAGLLLIAFLVLVLTVVRYWHVIHWSIH